MYNERLKPINIVVNLGIALVALGLVLQTFVETAGLYCFTIGVVLILVYIAMKIGQFDRKEEE